MPIPSPRNPLRIPLNLPLGLNDAIRLAVNEVKKLGLDLSHRVGALYAAPDLHTEGAAFAATVVPRDENGAAERFKLLIACDGRVSVCPFAKRCARPCKVPSRS